MLPIAAIQHWATIVPDYVATALVLLLGTVLTAAFGVTRGRDAVGRWLPGTLYVGLCGLAMWPAWMLGLRWLSWLLLGGAAGILVFHLPSARGEVGEALPSSGTGGSYLMLALGLGGLLLFFDLGSYSGDQLLAWEATVVGRFAHAFLRGQPMSQFTLRRLLWDDGVVSGGNTSLFYGAPTYALFHIAGFSPWTLRCAAAVAALISIVVAYALARRFFGCAIAAALAVLVALNPAVLFYGRYGSSPAGTLLAVLLAVFATWVFLERDRSAWWRALVCAAALYVATLQYSPARIVVLMLLAFIPVVLAFEWRQLGWQRPVGLFLIAAVAAVVWQFQGAFQRQEYFLRARGEQFFELVTNPDYLEAVYGQQNVPPSLRAGAGTFLDEVELLRRTLVITIPQYLKVMAPALTPPAQGAVLTSDPPSLPLYYGPVALFIAWGVAHALRRWRAWPQLFVLLWVVAGTVPLLLTNRVDAHRAVLFVIPLSCWAAFGVWEAAQVLAAAAVPPWIRHGLAVALIFTGAYSATNLLYYERPPRPPAGPALAAELASVPGRVSVAVTGSHREIAWAHLQILERARQDVGRSGRLLDQRLVHEMQADHPPSAAVVEDLRSAVSDGTLLMIPAENFRALADILAAQGLHVTEGGVPEFRVLRVENNK